MSKVSGVYEIVNKVNGHRYIGSSVHFCSRCKQHLSMLRANKHHSNPLQNAWNKYGEENFEFKLLVEIPRQSIRFVEQVFLDEEMGEYNCSDSALRPIIVYGRIPWNKGKKATNETRMKLSIAHMGYIPTDEHRQSLRIASIRVNSGQYLKDWTGVKRQRDGVERSRTAKIGVPLSAGHKRKLSDAHKGKKLSADHINNITRSLCKFTLEEEKMISYVVSFSCMSKRKIALLYGITHSTIDSIIRRSSNKI